MVKSKNVFQENVTVVQSKMFKPAVKSNKVTKKIFKRVVESKTIFNIFKTAVKSKNIYMKNYFSAVEIQKLSKIVNPAVQRKKLLKNL